MRFNEFAVLLHIDHEQYWEEKSAVRRLSLYIPYECVFFNIRLTNEQAQITSTKVQHAIFVTGHICMIIVSLVIARKIMVKCFQINISWNTIRNII